MNFIIQLIVGIVLSVASSLLQQAFSRPQEQQRRQTGTRGSVQIGGKVPQYFLLGTVGEAGKLEYRGTWGNDGEVPNAYLTEVMSFGDLPISGLAKLYVNGSPVTLSGAGEVGQGFPVPQYPGHLWWKFLPGGQTVADNFLVQTFAGAEKPWQTDMVGRGIPYLVTTALWSETLWTGFPSFIGEFQGIPVYDPRLDSSAGGNGPQRWGQPATYAFSDNNAVLIYNIERGIYYQGQHIWGGHKSAAELPYAVWAAAMDACDQNVPLAAGGSEKRFRAGRRVNLNERPADVIKDLLIGANARISHASDGAVYILVGVPGVADGAFADADVLATERLGSIPFPNLDEIINGATATYREPLQAWEDKETSPYYRSDLETEDDGRRQTEGLDLGTTFSGTQAQRVLQAVVEEGRRFRRHVVALPPEFAQYRPLQVLAWTSDRFDYGAKLFLITVRTRDPWGNVVFGLQEIDPADHAWTPSTDERPLSFAPVIINRPPPQPVSGFFVEPAVAVDSSGVGRRPAVDVFWSAPSVTVDVRHVRITVVLPDADDDSLPGDLVWEGIAPRPELGAARLTEGLLPNEDYLVQIQYVSESGRDTLGSSWLPVKTPNVKLGADDVAIDLSNVARDVIAQIGSTRSLIEAFKRIGTMLEEADRENYTKRETLFREIMVQMDGLEASFTEIIEVALGPGGAIATALESLYAALGGNSSQVNIRWEAVAAPDGYSARYAIQAAVNDGTFRSATLFLDVPADASQPTRIGLMAGQTAFLSAAGVPIAIISDDGVMRAGNDSWQLNMNTGTMIMKKGSIESEDGEFQVSPSLKRISIAKAS